MDVQENVRTPLSVLILCNKQSGAADQAAANDSSGQFVKLPASGNAAGGSDVALRIRRGDTLIEVSNDASDGILTLLKEVMTYAV